MEHKILLESVSTSQELYILKQPPYAWFRRFTQAMNKYGYCQENSDHTLFIKWNGGKVTLLIIYVDGMVVIWDDVAEIEKLQGYLGSEFEIKVFTCFN